MIFHIERILLGIIIKKNEVILMIELIEKLSTSYNDLRFIKNSIKYSV